MSLFGILQISLNLAYLSFQMIFRLKNNLDQNGQGYIAMIYLN
jgi:hypothetical protein